MSERAFQDREIVYFLKSPETHAFSLYHDYTETREGIDDTSTSSRRAARSRIRRPEILDTGEALKTETLKGQAITQAKVDIGEPVRPDSEIVVIRFPPVKKGQSAAPAHRRDLHRPGALRSRSTVS